MLFTILILLFTVIVVPYIALNFGTEPTILQWEILNQMSIVVGGVISYCFIVGELSRNNSQVDKLWSIVPIWYAWHMTVLGGMNERMVLMSVLVTIWGIRLTYNFARRGAYVIKFWEGEEDYRWEELRKRPGFKNRFVWMLFNLFFISGYQNILIFLFTLPVLTALSTENRPLNYIDWILTIIYVGCVVIEYIADQQQFDFQTEKYRRIRTGEALNEFENGFVSNGLWSIVRHPNYSMEQSIWLVFYLFSVNATGEWINWSIPGCLLLIVLFKGSSDFSEEISSRKYPKYKDYIAKTPRFIPFGNKIRLF
jgi:steroid 5-alpha reductase family enzyme